MNSTEETEVQCPVCRGRGSVQVTDGSGARREEPCPLCRGRGKVTQRRVRRLFERMSRRYPLHGLRQPHPQAPVLGLPSTRASNGLGAVSQLPLAATAG